MTKQATNYLACRSHHQPTTMNEFSTATYQEHGFENRADYLNSLKDEYGAELVDTLTSVLPPSEDFDGLISELEENDGLFDFG